MQRLVVFVFMALVLINYPASAQGPLQRLRERNTQQTLPRGPNNQIEGSLWEYKLTPRGEADPDSKQMTSGRFRTEGEAVFDATKRLSVSGGGNIREKLQQARSGESTELSMPEGPHQKRIGEYHFNSNSLVLQFDDPETLHGTMNLRKKKDTKTVWTGQYIEKDGKKTVAKWSAELRLIED